MTENLFGYKGMSEATGVSENTLRVWKSRGKLPEPDFIVHNGIATPAWRPETVNGWWRNLVTVSSEPKEEAQASSRRKLRAAARRKAEAMGAMLKPIYPLGKVEDKR